MRKLILSTTLLTGAFLLTDGAAWASASSGPDTAISPVGKDMTASESAPQFAARGDISGGGKGRGGADDAATHA